MKREKRVLSYQKIDLANGATLYVLQMPWVKTVGLGIHVNIGTRDEAWPKEAGLAHAMEHMVFQGTERFADSKTITEYLESVGGKLNAFTWNEFTCFFNYLPSEEKARGFEILSQQLRKSLFLPEKIKSEMENIVHEIDRSNDNPFSFLEDKFFEVLCGEHPLSKRTLGTEESVRAFQKEDFQNWQRKFYHPSNFTYVAVGDIEPKEAKLYFEEYFPEKASQPNIRKFESISETPGDVMVEKELEQAHMMLGAITSGKEQRDSSVLSLFRVMISGGMSFPLFQEVRDKRGLCYAIQADFHPLSDNGIFNIYIGTSPDKMEEAADCIINVVQESKDSQELLEKAKKSLRGKLAFRFESPKEILQSALFDIIYRGKPRGYEEILEEMQSISIEEVEAAVNRYLNPERILKVALIPKI
jgi:predicted Zn-dependent peptidase